MTTLYLILAIVALSAVIGAIIYFNRQKVKGLNDKITIKQSTIDTLQDEIEGQQKEIKKRDQMIDALQEIEIEHLKKTNKLRTPDPRVNVRNATDIMQDLARTGDSDKDSSSP